jgi:hypothetical protein
MPFFDIIESRTLYLSIGERQMKRALLIASAIVLVSPFVYAAATPDAGQMSFFVTSIGSGKGGNLGGLEGADKHCQTLAAAVGAGKRTWRAYLSASGGNGKPAVNARDRIGKGPWRNIEGTVIAKSIDDLHGPNNNIRYETALTEQGIIVAGRLAAVAAMKQGKKPPQVPEVYHDMLTGSTADGKAFPAGSEDHTCKDWTSDSEGAPQVGHHDRNGGAGTGGGGGHDGASWNSAHLSRGCSQELVSVNFPERPFIMGGKGYFYCFAAD